LEKPAPSRRSAAAKENTGDGAEDPFCRTRMPFIAKEAKAAGLRALVWQYGVLSGGFPSKDATIAKKECETGWEKSGGRRRAEILRLAKPLPRMDSSLGALRLSRGAGRQAPKISWTQLPSFRMTWLLNAKLYGYPPKLRECTPFAIRLDGRRLQCLHLQPRPDPRLQGIADIQPVLGFLT